MYEDPDVLIDTGSAAMKETKTVEDYLVPYRNEMKEDWFLAGGVPPSMLENDHVSQIRLRQENFLIFLCR